MSGGGSGGRPARMWNRSRRGAANIGIQFVKLSSPSGLLVAFRAKKLMDVRIRVMKRADIPAGMRLKDLAGWNQTEADWERFLHASPDGCFVAEAAEPVVGSSTTLRYAARFAWIGTLL